MTASTYVVKRERARAPLLRKSGLRLKQLDVELTERCNSNCIHCCINLPANDASARSREMTAEQVRDILRQAADLGCLQVRFTGGEPLLRHDFEEIYIFSRRLGLKVLLFTNARLVTPHLADLFARMPPSTPIEITVYGMHAASYEAVTRSRGSFAQFRRGLDLLLDRKVPCVVKSVILPQNKHEMAEFEAWARTISGMTKPPAYAMFLDPRHRRDDPEKNAVIESLRLPPGEAVEVLSRDAVKYRRDMAAFASRFLTPPTDRLFSCGAGHGVCIDAYGYVQPCLGLRAPELTFKLTSRPTVNPEEKSAESGAVSEKENGAITLAEALERFRECKDLCSNNPEYLGRCAKCFLKGLCEQCPAKSWMEHGNLDTPVACLCEAAHAQARRLGWLAENEHGWEIMDWRGRIDATGQ
jgi:MoaA/NifB/PqqE/SkfB family radical SAM enzyme